MFIRKIDYPMDTDDAIAEMRAKIEAGMEQAKAGKVLNGEKVFADLEKGF